MTKESKEGNKEVHSEKTDAKGRILIGGKAVENVYAVGKILGGKDNAGK